MQFGVLAQGLGVLFEVLVMLRAICSDSFSNMNWFLRQVLAAGLGAVCVCVNF